MALGRFQPTAVRHVAGGGSIAGARVRPRAAWLVLAAVLAACASHDPVVIDLGARLDGERAGEVRATIAIDGAREVRIVTGEAPLVVEAWIDGAEIAGAPAEQLATGTSPAWLAPQPVEGELTLDLVGTGTHALTVWGRGTPPPAASRSRSLAWFEPALLDDTATISFARVMAAISDDGHGGALLERWFTAFATGPGAGRATFAQFLDDLRAAHGTDPRAWDLGALPFRVTGVHNRLDLAHDEHCGELRVSVASTDPTFSPLHLIFLFRQPAAADDVTPDGTVHCRGTARRWARLAALDEEAFVRAARAVLDEGLTHARFLLAESVELTLSPWQWRQWAPDGTGGLTNPRLFQTIDVARVNAPGPARDAFLAAVRASADAIAARTWAVPDAFRSQVAEVQPNAQAALVDLAPLPDVLARYPELPRAAGMIGCPRCHTDDADFVQTSVDRRPSPFYDRELDARTTRLDALAGTGWPAPAPFGPLQPL